MSGQYAIVSTATQEDQQANENDPSQEQQQDLGAISTDKHRKTQHRMQDPQEQDLGIGQEHEQGTGNITTAGPTESTDPDDAAHTREHLARTVTQRLQQEGRWAAIVPQRDEMMRLAKKQFSARTSSSD